MSVLGTICKADQRVTANGAHSAPAINTTAHICINTRLPQEPDIVKKPFAKAN
jgi:hypothetical protein